MRIPKFTCCLKETRIVHTEGENATVIWTLIAEALVSLVAIATALC